MTRPVGAALSVILGLSCTTAHAIELRLVPTAATGSTAVVNTSDPLDTQVTIDAGEIIRVDVYVANWGGEALRGVQVELRQTSLTSGTAGELSIRPLDISPADGVCDLDSAFCPFCGPVFDSNGIYTDACRRRCGDASGELCAASNPSPCPDDGGLLACLFGFPDFFGLMPNIFGQGVGADNPNILLLTWLATADTGALDDGFAHYVSTLILQADTAARGTFTLSHWPSPCVGCTSNGSFVRNENGQPFVQPTLLGQCRVHIRSGRCCLNGTCLGFGTDEDCVALGGENWNPGVPCAIGSPCVCSADSECLDVDPCNGLESCDEGANLCLAGTPLTCDDANPCTVDSCDRFDPAAAADGCVNDAGPLAGQTCNDFDVCTLEETCVNGACVPVGMLDCDDGDPCTADSCDPVTGCLHDIPGGNGAVCNDGVLCTFDLCFNDVCLSEPFTYGDVNGDEFVNGDDVLCLADHFSGLVDSVACGSLFMPAAALARRDLAPCPTPGDPAGMGDGFINSDDILAVLDRFAGRIQDPLCLCVASATP